MAPARATYGTRAQAAAQCQGLKKKQLNQKTAQPKNSSTKKQLNRAVSHTPPRVRVSIGTVSGGIPLADHSQGEAQPAQARGGSSASTTRTPRIGHGVPRSPQEHGPPLHESTSNLTCVLTLWRTPDPSRQWVGPRIYELAGARPTILIRLRMRLASSATVGRQRRTKASTPRTRRPSATRLAGYLPFPRCSGTWGLTEMGGEVQTVAEV